MRKYLLPVAAAIGLSVMVAGSPPQAATPSNMVVMAWQIDELISLDPAEIYEFAPAELAANFYDRVVYYDIASPNEMKGGAAESWTVSDDGKTFTFKIRDGI
jgi:peptide/nickel transport system substrate-binding protein